MESKAISGVTSTCSNTCTTPVGHTGDYIAYPVGIYSEVQHHFPGEILGFPYTRIFYNLVSTGSTKKTSLHDQKIVDCDVKHNSNYQCGCDLLS